MRTCSTEGANATGDGAPKVSLSDEAKPHQSILRPHFDQAWSDDSWSREIDELLQPSPLEDENSRVRNAISFWDQVIRRANK